MWTRWLGGFSVMWVTKLLFTPEKKGIFAQKQPNLAQNWRFWSILARPCRLIQCPVGGSVGGCGARAVSRKTPIYFMLEIFFINNIDIDTTNNNWYCGSSSCTLWICCTASRVLQAHCLDRSSLIYNLLCCVCLILITFSNLERRFFSGKWRV